MILLQMCTKNGRLLAIFVTLALVLDACSIGEDNLNRVPKATAPDTTLTFDNSSGALLSGRLASSSVDYDGTIKSTEWRLSRVVSLTKLDPQKAPLPVTNNSRQLLNACILTRPTQQELSFSVLPQAAVYYFKLTVYDNSDASNSTEVKVTVLPRGESILAYNSEWSETNAAVAAGPNLRVSAKDNVILSAFPFNIIGATSYHWQISDNAGLSFTLPQDQGQTIQFRAPDSPDNRRLILTLTATNGIQQFIDDVSVEILSGTGPQIAAIPSQIVHSNDLVQLNAVVDGTPIRFKWTQLLGTPVTLLGDTLANTRFTAPIVTQQDLLRFEIEVEDEQNLVAHGIAEVTVLPPTISNNNQAPQVSAGADQTVTFGARVTLSGNASDSDGQVVSYQWTQISGPSVTLINANTTTLSFDAPKDFANRFGANMTFQLSAKDNLNAQGTDQVTVVMSANQPPLVDAGANQTVTSASTVNLSASASDIDTAIRSITWSQLQGPAVQLSALNALQTSFIAPLVTQSTILNFRLTVVDDLDSTSVFDNVVITVNPPVTNPPPPGVNNPPSVNAGPDQTVNPGTSVSLQGSASDSDGSVASTRWSQLPGGPSITFANANSVSTSFVAPNVNQTAIITLQLTATDNNNASASDQVAITLYPLVSLSGTISINNANLVDSDINQTGVSIVTVSNDSIAGAQHISNPFVLGGYVNQPGAGAAGRSQSGGDIDDFYHVTLNAGQIVTLRVGDALANVNEVGLVLLEETAPNNVVDVSLSGGNTQSVTATLAGNYFIQVTSLAGASNYVLNSAGTTPLQTSGWTLRDDFVANEIIAQQRPGVSAAVFSRIKSNVGIASKAGASDRNQLFGLQNAVTKSIVSNNKLWISADPALQDKLNTLVKAAQLRRDPNFINVSLNYLLQPSAIPNDTNYSLQWDMGLMNLPTAWDTTMGSNNVIVAVIDTGILPNHPDFAGQLLPGYDFIRNATQANDGNGIDNDPTDTGNGDPTKRSDFHGTHVAGTVAAATNNARGVAGVAGGVRIMPLRVVGIGGATSYDVEQAVRYAAGLANDSNTVPTQIADVINLSLGGSGGTSTAPSAFRQARAAGVIIVAAAGNNGTNQLITPAGYDGVVSVSAITMARQRAVYSNYGPTIDIAAPGGSGGDINNDGYPDEILSLGADDSGPTLVYEYNFKLGTSMASPHVAGVAALMKSVFPGLTPDIFDALLANGDLTQDIGSPGRDDLYGYGMMDAAKAVNAAIIAGGGSVTPPNPAQLSVSPTSIGFGVSLNSQILSISNGGGDTLTITGLTPSASWLRISPLTVDSNNVGSYSVSVVRSGLTDNIYNGSIRIDSNVGSVNVSVSMQVLSMAIAVNAGPQVIELVNNNNGQLADKLIVNAINGQYAYIFPSVSLGEYRIRSSSDLDNDGKLCELGESCGAYPLLDSSISSTILVDGINTNLNNLDFTTGFNPNLPP